MTVNIQFCILILRVLLKLRVLRDAFLGAELREETGERSGRRRKVLTILQTESEIRKNEASTFLPSMVL